MCTNSIKLHRLLLLDSGLCIAKPWMLYICYCTKSIKLHRLLLLDSGLCIANPWMLCFCYCTKSIKLHRLLLLDSGLCIAQSWMLCICTHPIFTGYRRRSICEPLCSIWNTLGTSGVPIWNSLLFPVGKLNFLLGRS